MWWNLNWLWVAYLQVLDTAGIRETADFVEKIESSDRFVAPKQPDLVLLTIDASDGWTVDDQEIYEQVQHRPLILVNKIDLVETMEASLPYPHTISHVVTTAAAYNRGSKP